MPVKLYSHIFPHYLSHCCHNCKCKLTKLDTFINEDVCVLIRHIHVCFYIHFRECLLLIEGEGETGSVGVGGDPDLSAKNLKAA
jgi:hypothetical protein